MSRATVAVGAIVAAVSVLPGSRTEAYAQRPDVVIQWNDSALQAIRANKTSPPQASHALAMLHIAIFAAVNDIVRTHDSYFVPSNVPASASPEAATSAAARLVLTTIFRQTQLRSRNCTPQSCREPR